MTDKRSFPIFFWVSYFFFILLIFSSVVVHAKEKGRNYFEARGEAVWEVPTEQKVIALSFDDGPNPQYTPQILDLLKKYHAKATFFVIGKQVEKYPELVKLEALEGHEVANHTYHHSNISRLSPEQLEEELSKANHVIFSVTGQFPRLFRPPGGFYNESIIRTARKAGYTVIMWTLDTRDWSRPGQKKIVSTFLSRAHNGTIALFHDHGRDRRQTISSLRIILPELQDKGYKFITVSELLQLK